ncbi:MAG TPA: hypothetical protein VFI22_00990 [Thermomicrobiales bacterium]|nr:hypothetical protein [Thermomicrobiales bacterium]
MIRWANAWRTTRRTSGTLAIAALLGAGMAGSVQARDRVDQQNPIGDGGGFGIGISQSPNEAQTFTAGKTGKLDRVAVDLSPTGGTVPKGTMIAEIFPTDEHGAPDTDAAALASGQVKSKAVSRNGGFVSIRLDEKLPIAEDTVYAIVLHADAALAGALSWDGSSGPPDPDQYPRGTQAELVNNTWVLHEGQDFHFKTYVAVHHHHHRHHR